MNSLVNKRKFKINDIIKILPHRYPFILLDSLEIIEPGKFLTALKNVTINEPFFPGTFPEPANYAWGAFFRGFMPSGVLFNVKSS